LDDLFLRHHDRLEQVIEVPLLGLFPDGLGNLVLEVRVGLHDVPALAHGRLIRSLVHPPPKKVSAKVTIVRMIQSANMKNIDATAVIENPMPVVMAVSRRDGQVTFWPSARTSCRNLNGLTLAMDSPAKWQYTPAARINNRPNGKERNNSRGLAAPRSANGPG